jgi:hypothetical protein
MSLLLVFAAGVVIGKGWKTVRDVVVPFAGNASERFDMLYSQTAQAVVRRVEDVEDRVAERRYHAGRNGSAQAPR